MSGEVVRLTKLGHACALLEGAGGGRLLLDPGDLAGDLSALPPFDAVVVTHAHPDHVDTAKLAQAVDGRKVPVIGSPGAEDLVRNAGIDDFSELEEGSIQIAGIEVTAHRTPHAVIHPDFPLPPHFSLTFGDRLYTPGDSFVPPPHPVQVLLTPLGAPWMKLSEAIEFVRQVQPPRAVPFHDGGLGPAHHALHTALLRRFAPAATQVDDFAVGCVFEL